MGSTNPASGPSDTAAELTPRKRYLEARHSGAYSHTAYKEFMVSSIRSCLQHRLRRLLVDISALRGFAPTMAQRFEMGDLGSKLGSELERVAILGTPSQIEGGFATLVARNRGLDIQAFIDREEALGWLLKEPQRP